MSPDTNLHLISDPSSNPASQFKLACQQRSDLGNVITAKAKLSENETMKARCKKATRRVRLLVGFFLLLTLMFLPFCEGAQAQSTLDKLQGLCTRGGQNITTAGANSSQKAEMVVPSCTVTVYVAGTLTPATIYSNRASTPTLKANPFTANSAGEWFFYTTSGRYDIRFSGGTGPGAYPAPVTYGDFTITAPATSFTDYRGAINVSQAPYNCAGDNVTDDTACIQAAIDAAAVGGTKEVYLPAPAVKYLVTGLTVPGGVTLVGDGRDKTRIRSVTNAPILNLVEGSGAYQFLAPQLRNLGVEGSRSAGSNQIGIKADDNLYIVHGMLDKLSIQDCGGSGLYTGNIFSSTFRDIRSDNNEGYNFEYYSANMPGNRFEMLYSGAVSDSHPVGFRVRRGIFNCYNCNGINASPAGSSWAIVGDKAGVDGSAGNAGAFAHWEDCNVESWNQYGILHYPGSRSDYTNAFFAGAGLAWGIAEPISYEVDPSAIPTSAAKSAIDDGTVFANSYSEPLTGTVATNIGSPALIGTGTLFTTELIVGQFVIINSVTYTVLLIADDLTATLTTNASATVAGVTGNRVYYKKGFPIHANDVPPLTVRGQGPKIAGNAFQAEYWNNANLRREALYRSDGYAIPAPLVTTSTNYTNPGYRHYSVNCASNCTLTLPWPGWYNSSNEIVTIKNNSVTGVTVTVSANSGGAVNGLGSYFMSINGGSVQLWPNHTTLDWEVVGNRIGTGSSNYYAVFDSVNSITSAGSLIQNLSSDLLFGARIVWGSDNLYDIGTNSDNRPRNVYIGNALVSPYIYNIGGGPCFSSGTLTPEGSVTCEPGSIYLRTDGTWYQKQSGSGNTGWVVFTGSGGGAGVTSLGGTTNQITVSAPTGAVSLSLEGPHNFSTATTNGVAYGNGTGPILFTAAGGGGTLCLTSTGGAAPVWGACAGSAATAWDALTAPGAGNLSLNMTTFLTTFSWATGTGANNLFNLTSAAAANGTGYVLNVTTGAGAALKPLNVTAQGSANGIEMSTTGVLSAKGTGEIQATPPGTTGSIPYNNGAGLFDGAANAILDTASSTIILGTSTSQNGQLQLRNATNAFTTTIAPGVPGANNTLTLPATTDTLAGIAATQTFTNKTLTSATNVLGGVTLTLGSDANGDTYYRAGGVLTRIAIGTAGQCYKVNGGATAPEWSTCSSTPALTATYIGFGDGANLLTGTDRFSFDNTNRSVTVGESGNAGQTNITLRSTNTSSALFTSSGAGRPGSQGGIIFDNVGGDQTQGPGLTWSNGNYNVTSRLYISLGLNWQGYDTAGQSFLIRKSTATSSQGTKVFELRPNDGYFEVSPFSTGAGNTTEIRQLELLASGTNYFATKAADAITTSYTMVWPTDTPVAGDRLSVIGLSGSTITTEWLAGGGSGTVTNTGTLTSGKAIIGNGGADITASRLTLTNPATTATFTLADNKTFTVNNSITLTGTDSTTLTFPAITDTIAGVGTSNTFTVQQTINGGTTSGADRLLLNVTALGSNGVRSSPNIIQRGSSYDGSAHTVDWRFRTVPTTNAGASQWELQSRVDAASYVTNLQVDDQGVLTISDVVVENGNIVLNDVGVSRVSSTLLEINDTAVGNYLDLKVRQYHADATISATSGNQTINKALFSFVIGAGTTNAVITNSFVTTSSLVICTPQRKDTTLLTVAAEPAAGSVTITGNAGATANTAIACMVFNQ